MTSVLFHEFRAFRTALQFTRLGAVPAVMPLHHQGSATRAEGTAKPPEGSLVPFSGGRQTRLTMDGIAGAVLPTQKTGQAILKARYS